MVSRGVLRSYWTSDDRARRATVLPSAPGSRQAACSPEYEHRQAIATGPRESRPAHGTFSGPGASQP